MKKMNTKLLLTALCGGMLFNAPFASDVQDETGAAQNTGTKVISTKDVMLIANGFAPANPLVNVTWQAPNAKLTIVSGGGYEFAPLGGTFKLMDGAYLDLTGNGLHNLFELDLDLKRISSGKKVSIELSSKGTTIANALSAVVDLIAHAPELTSVSDLTVNADSLAANLDLRSPLQITSGSSVSTLSGAVKGDYNLTLSKALTFAGSFSGYKGIVKVGANVSMAALPSSGTISVEGAFAVTSTKSGTVGRLRSSDDTASFVANENVTISALDLTGNKITLKPAAGKTITVTGYTPGSHAELIIDGEGTVKLPDKSKHNTTGGVKVTKGTVKY